MNDLESLTNESFNDLLEEYFSETETYNHYEFAVELARESTGYGTMFEVLENEDLADYTGYDIEEDTEYEHDGFFLSEVAHIYVAQLNDGISTINLKLLPYFDELYSDFTDVTGYEGSKDDFEYNLRRSVDFFDFVVDISTRE